MQLVYYRCPPNHRIARFLPLVESSSTKEDAYLARRIVDQVSLENKNLIIVTSDYHMPRAKFVFDTFFPNYYIVTISSGSKIPENKYKTLIQEEQQKLRQLEQKIKEGLK